MSSTSWMAFCVFSSAAAMSSCSAIVPFAVYLWLFSSVDMRSYLSARVFECSSCSAFKDVAVCGSESIGRL